MRLKTLTITEGFFNKTFNLDANATLIHSFQNSAGKTTLLRTLLYALGFSIPNTKNFKMEKYTFELSIITDSGKELIITRQDSYCHILNIENNEKNNFSLPANVDELHSTIFEKDNNAILENLLGVIYIDQEKGWTLLNRGIVIGSNRFNIQKFIQGVANIDCSFLYDELSYVETQINKYKSMLNVASYQRQIEKLTQVYEYDSFNDKIEKEIAVLEFEKQPLLIEKRRLDNILKKNMEFKNYISNMQLYVIDEDGKRTPVNEKTIDGFRDNTSYITTKINIIHSKISKLDKRIKELGQTNKKENFLLQTNTETMIEKFDADISKINIDYIGVERMINNLESERLKIKEEINSKTKSNYSLISELHETISSYAKEMGVDEHYVSPSKDYIFTSDLKSLSGAIFHKIVFSFRLAYIKILEKYSNINVPIILDSPRGKEVDEANIAIMVDILKRDFSNHQIIIASIYNYNFENLNSIELKERLLEY